MTALALQDKTALDPRFARPERLFFVIGAQKAGTTWLHDYCSGHPQICVPVFKELDYWSAIRGGFGTGMLRNRLAKLEGRSPLRRAVSGFLFAKKARALELAERLVAGETPGHASYADALFQTYTDQRAAGEISPQYAMLGRDAFAEMNALGRDVRFALVMRDPLSRFFSGVKHSVRAVHGDTGVTDDRVRDLWMRQLDKAERVYSLLRSSYDMTIRELEAAVPQDRIGYFFYETLFTQAEVDRFCRLLGVDPRPARLGSVRHGGAGKSVAMPADLAERTLALLAPTYEFLRARFGDQIPASWRKPKLVAAPAAAQTREA